MTAPFDRVVVVDWSAASTPKRGRDSIWVAERDASTGEVRTSNPPTRAVALERLRAIACAPGRALIGVDACLGYPAGTAAALGLRPGPSGSPWSATWALLAAELTDGPDNANDRFKVAAALNERIGPGPGPFWGCTPRRAGPHLTATKVPSDPLPEWRAVERELRTRGRRPFSCWQLLGAGAVGSQSLLAIAALHRLRDDVAATSGRAVDVWPLSTGLVVPGAPVVLAEVWPSLVPPDDDHADGRHLDGRHADGRGRDEPVRDERVRDEAQVEALSAHLVALQRDGALGAAFSPDVGGAERAVVAEEGWVLGV